MPLKPKSFQPISIAFSVLLLFLVMVYPAEWGKVQSDMQGWRLPGLHQAQHRAPPLLYGDWRVTKWGWIPCSTSPQKNHARNLCVILNVRERVFSFTKLFPALFQEALYSTALDRVHFSSLYYICTQTSCLQPYTSTPLSTFPPAGRPVEFCLQFVGGEISRESNISHFLVWITLLSCCLLWRVFKWSVYH